MEKTVAVQVQEDVFYEHLEVTQDAKHQVEHDIVAANEQMVSTNPVLDPQVHDVTNMFYNGYIVEVVFEIVYDSKVAVAGNVHEENHEELEHLQGNYYDNAPIDLKVEIQIHVEDLD